MAALKRCLSLALLFAIIDIQATYKLFQDKIPNGDGVPHPCLANHIWQGVGHQNRQGGGERNPFGLAFAANDFKWNASLCYADSDGDGRTNGEELGDPDCVWTPGSIPAKTMGLSHPGICEDINSDKCKAQNTWDFCSKQEFSCPSLKSPDVQNLTLKLDRTAVPPTVTNYYCQAIDLPHDQDYHIIGSQPALDNTFVIHHMLLYGCNPEGDEMLEQFRTAGPCDMLAAGACSNIIAAWTVGLLGECAGDLPAGTRIGKTIFSKALLQVHWNNPQESPVYFDGSGLNIFYTNNLRPHDLATIPTGQLGLRIPAGQASFKQSGKCRSDCTRKMLNDTINIHSINLHMHYLGRGGYVEQYRDGAKVATLVRQDDYSYDSPKQFIQTPPAQFQPGDEFRMGCDFKSTKHANAVYYGDGTQDEMCLAFIQYYPAYKAFSACPSIGDFQVCGKGKLPKSHAGCEFSKLANPAYLFSKIRLQCDVTGKECRDSCLKLFTVNPHPCLQGSPKLMVESFVPRLFGEQGRVLQRALRSCDSVIFGDSLEAGNQPQDTVNAGSSLFSDMAVLWVVLAWISNIV